MGGPARRRAPARALKAPLGARLPASAVSTCPPCPPVHLSSRRCKPDPGEPACLAQLTCHRARARPMTPEGRETRKRPPASSPDEQAGGRGGRGERQRGPLVASKLLPPERKRPRCTSSVVALCCVDMRPTATSSRADRTWRMSHEYPAHMLLHYHRAQCTSRHGGSVGAQDLMRVLPIENNKRDESSERM